MDQQNHRACTRSSPQLMVENLRKWQEGPQQITRLVQDGSPQLMVENPGKWWEGPHWFLRITNKTAPSGATKLILKKENTNYFFYYCFLSLIPSILFCFVSSIMGVDLYTSFQKCCCFWLENRGSTYTRIDLYRENTVLHVKNKGSNLSKPFSYMYII